MAQGSRKASVMLMSRSATKGNVLSAVEVKDDELAQRVSRQQAAALNEHALEALDGGGQGEEVAEELGIGIGGGCGLGSRSGVAAGAVRLRVGNADGSEGNKSSEEVTHTGWSWGFGSRPGHINFQTTPGSLTGSVKNGVALAKPDSYPHRQLSSIPGPPGIRSGSLLNGHSASASLIPCMQELRAILGAQTSPSLETWQLSMVCSDFIARSRFTPSMLDRSHLSDHANHPGTSTDLVASHPHCYAMQSDTHTRSHPQARRTTAVHEASCCDCQQQVLPDAKRLDACEEAVHSASAPHTLADACERLADIARLADDLRRRLAKHDSGYEQAYFSEQHKLLQLASAYNALAADNERLSQEVECYRQHQLPRHDLLLQGQAQEMQAVQQETRKTEEAARMQQETRKTEESARMQLAKTWARSVDGQGEASGTVAGAKPASQQVSTVREAQGEGAQRRAYFAKPPSSLAANLTFSLRCSLRAAANHQSLRVASTKRASDSLRR
ncbi:hypothetical protein OPT61_g6411 [Boeremia exigua]|uniref:Uncharacterized protein n=1 Tax=Boeremia exigua TaxID=749465 RepID=A0ACC2I6Q3_9PLEO|nr:hypothetical protein OPT61_g6411 [Boeremia exigua]